MTPFDFRPRTRVLFGAGEFARLGEVARELGGTKCLLVADQGMLDCGYAQEAIRTLKARRIEVFAFHDFSAGPTAAMVQAGADYVAPHHVNLIVAVGGGSSHGLRQGHQLCRFQRGLHSRLLGLRQGRQADAAHDRRPYHGRNRK